MEGQSHRERGRPTDARKNAVYKSEPRVRGIPDELRGCLSSCSAPEGTEPSNAARRIGPRGGPGAGSTTPRGTTGHGRVLSRSLRPCKSAGGAGHAGGSDCGDAPFGASGGGEEGSSEAPARREMPRPQWPRLAGGRSDSTWASYRDPSELASQVEPQRHTDRRVGPPAVHRNGGSAPRASRPFLGRPVQGVARTFVLPRVCTIRGPCSRVPLTVASSCPL